MPAATTPRDVGSEIRAEMGRQRISMLKLSSLTSIPRVTLADQINGKARMAVETLVSVAKALGVDPSNFLPESEQASA